MVSMKRMLFCKYLLSFDSSVEDIFTPLISGSKLVIVRHQDRFNIVCLEDIINKQKVTHFLITPGFTKPYSMNLPIV